MSNNVNFVTSYKATTHATLDDIWNVWVDVNNWKKWDNGIENSEILTEFATGHSFLLTPQGGEPIKVALKTVIHNQEFSDEAILPFGTLRNIHRIEKLGEQITITHEVHAEINKEAAGFFGKEIWPHMQDGLPSAVNNIISIVTAN